MKWLLAVVYMIIIWRESAEACSVISFSDNAACLVGRNWDYGDSTGDHTVHPGR